MSRGRSKRWIWTSMVGEGSKVPVKSGKRSRKKWGSAEDAGTGLGQFKS